MIRRSKAAAALLMLIGFLAIAPNAGATSLLPGGTVAPLVDASATGTLLASTGLINFTSTGGDLVGMLAAAVYQGTLGLDFYYQVFNYRTSSSTSTDAINRVTMSLFDSFTTDVVFRTDAPNAGTTGFVAGPSSGSHVAVAPTTADRSGNGNVVGFNFPIVSTPGTIIPGYYSDVLVIKTNAQYYSTGTTSVHDGTGTDVATFAPTTVPEPGSMMLFGTGLVGLASLVRRRRRS